MATFAPVRDPQRMRDLAIYRLWGAVQWIASVEGPGVAAEDLLANLRRAVIECHAEIEAVDAGFGPDDGL
ncbi:MAG TPA: hypothetical protein VN806_13025 [Caulobacteraceae bacterium]|nr:hypothetical protein [Caulobacteraceae bacterium]